MWSSQQTDRDGIRAFRADDDGLATALWTVPIAITVAMFGNYYADDGIAPVADLPRRTPGFRAPGR